MLGVVDAEVQLAAQRTEQPVPAVVEEQQILGLVGSGAQ